jgi:hypothetical protein
MSDYARYQRDGLAGALAIHLCIYCGVAGCFAFGLYELLQPTRNNNPGLAAYKPPPATVITHGLPSRLAASSPATMAQPAASALLITSEPETTGRSTRSPEPNATDLPPPRREADNSKKAKTLRREVKSEPATQPTQRERVACIPRYDSSGAQSSPC